MSGEFTGLAPHKDEGQPAYIIEDGRKIAVNGWGEPCCKVCERSQLTHDDRKSGHAFEPHYLDDPSHDSGEMPRR